MTTRCPSCYQNSCPETPDITLNQTILQFDGTTSFFYEERYLYANLTGSGTVITLAHVPVSNQSVLLFKNALAMRQGVDYTIYNAVITLLDAAVATDEFTARYFALEGDEAYKVETGAMIPFINPPTTGYLSMDGLTSHQKSNYTALWTFLVAHPAYVLSSDATSFVLADMTVVITIGGVASATRMYVKI